MQQKKRTRKRLKVSQKKGGKRRYSKKDMQDFRIKIMFCILLAATIILGIYGCVKGKSTVRDSGLKIDASEPEIDVQLLDMNEYSRPGTPTDTITGIVIHYTANPGSTAKQNRDYFNGLQDGHDTYASSHFVVGIEGEIVQCIPTAEVAYASNERNNDTVSIECCHPDETGRFTDATYESVVHLTAFLCKKFNLTEQDVIRHYDVTGKNCPKYFVENEEAWKIFRADVKAALERSEQQ